MQAVPAFSFVFALVLSRAPTAAGRQSRCCPDADEPV